MTSDRPVLGFVLAVALSPTGCVSEDLRRRALELTELFDATVELRPAEPDETDNRKRETKDG